MGFFVQMAMLIVIFLLIFMHQPIPDLVVDLFTGGMLTCIFFSFIVKGQGNKESLLLYSKGDIIRIAILIAPIVIMFLITQAAHK